MRWFALLLLLMLPAAAAQGAMYATDDGSGGTGNISYAASQEAPAPGKAYAAFAQGGLSYSTTFAGTLGQDYQPGIWELRIFLSCDVPTAYRPTTTTDVYRPTVTSTVSVGGKALPAVHGESTLRTCDGPSDVWQLVWEIDGSETSPTAGAEVSWLTSIWWLNPPPGATQNGYYVIGAAGSGLFGLVPAAPNEPTVAPMINGTLDEPFEQTFGQAFNGTYRLSVNTATNQTLAINVTQLAGMLGVTVQGAVGETYNQTVVGGLNETVAITPGNWTLIFVLDGFEGTLRAELVAADEPGVGIQPDHPSDPKDNATEEGGDVEEDAPGFPVVVGVVILAFLAARRRVV